MATRYVFDEDLTGVGELILRARSRTSGDVWVIGRDPCPITTGTPDEKWMPRAASEGWIVIRKDKDILRADTAEGRLWRSLGCRGFVLTLHDQSLWGQLRALVSQWPKVEDHISGQPAKGWWVGNITASRVLSA